MRYNLRIVQAEKVMMEVSMEKSNTYPTMRYILSVLFLLEMIGGVLVIRELYIYYEGIMSAGYLITLPLLGIVCMLSLYKHIHFERIKIYLVLTASVLLIVPILLLLIFFPTYSYDEAKELIRMEMGDQSNYSIEDTEDRTVSMSGTGNPMITHGYQFRVIEEGVPIDYIVSPVSGNVHKLED